MSSFSKNRKGGVYMIVPALKDPPSKLGSQVSLEYTESCVLVGALRALRTVHVTSNLLPRGHQCA